MQKLVEQLESFKVISRKKMKEKRLKAKKSTEFPPLYGFIVFKTIQEKMRIKKLFSNTL